MKKANYLVVDDESCIRELINAVFANEAHITEASDGKEALELLQQRQFDIVICDVQMPRLSGTELFRLVQAATPEVAEKFIFCTGNPNDELVRLCAEHHTTFCTKPINIAKLKSAVSMLNTRKASS